MNLYREVDWGLFARRSFALLIDSLLFISVFTVLTRIFNVLVPGSDVREDAMQLYTQKDFNVFMATSATALIFLATYMLTSYRSAKRQTIGHRCARIRIEHIDGKKIDFTWVLRIVIVAWLRLLLLLVPGPVVAYIGGPLIFSIFALSWGALLILPIPISKSKITIWEKLGGYRFVTA